MRRFVRKAKRAIKLISTYPCESLKRLQPYVFRAKSGLIKVNGINFHIDLELDPTMSSMYFGFYSYPLTSILRKLLREGDTFIDVGANVGYISAFALGLVGKSGSVHAFEPVPQNLARLRKVQEDNPDYSLHVNGVAVGEREGKASIAVTNLHNIGWNTMVPDFMSKDTIREEIEVRVIRLTDYLSANGVWNLCLVKIDTEGFEFPVMKGFLEYLHKVKKLPILIIEIAPSAYPKLGSTCGDFVHFMSELGYVSRSIDCAHDVQIDRLDKTTDVVFFPKNIV